MTASKQQIYKWINERETRSETEIPLPRLVKLCFPDRPQEILGDVVDIVVVTPDSA